MAIDMHAHWTPRGLIKKSAEGGDWYGWRILKDELGRAQAAPDVAERLTKAGLEPHATTPEQFSESVKRDSARFARLIKTLDIPLQ
jgi:hypothetical protein